MCIIILWWERGGGGVRISQVFGMFSVFNIFRKVLYTSIHSLSYNVSSLKIKQGGVL